MTKEKQIEEMFNIIVDGVIDGEDNNGVPTGNTCVNIAKALYEAGYAKQPTANAVAKMQEPIKKKYLLYVRYDLSGLFVFEVETNDIFHIMGRAVYCSEEHIKRINFVDDKEFRRAYWEDNGIKIRKIPIKWERKV